MATRTFREYRDMSAPDSGRRNGNARDRHGAKHRGKDHAEPAAGAGDRRDVDAATGPLDNAADDVQAEAAAVRGALGGEERVEDAGDDVVRHADALVGHIEDHHPGAALGGIAHEDVDVAARRHRVTGIRHEIDQHLIDRAAADRDV